MQSLRVATRWRVFTGVWIVIGMAAVYAFWTYAFFVNGLHHFSYADIYWQRTPGAGDFPFDSLANDSLLFNVLLLAMFFAQPLGFVVLPGLAVWIGIRWADHRRALPLYERSFWLLGWILALSATIFSWSTLWGAVNTWVMD